MKTLHHHLVRIKTYIFSLFADANSYNQLPVSSRFHPWSGAAIHIDRAFEQRSTGGVLLDIGCGPPETRGSISNISCSQYIGLDLLAAVKPTVVSSVDAICLGSATVDSVNCISLLEHVYEPQKVVSEMFRVLRPGGCIRLQVPFLLQYHGYPHDYYRYTHTAITRMFREAGFNVTMLEINWGKGAFLTAGRMLEDGSWSTASPLVRLISRICAKALFIMSDWLDRYHAPNAIGMYYGVIMLAEVPGVPESVTDLS